ncbi:granulocyte-macrophage colony-stimulating factor receptor subunit alpha-like isoform X2 [Dendropsophus ebraccatus]|uniref:granulocyte-macrophage colony-stimulating factor receptor subunit alpha-like isoform X2 n=1 Tax=Dendropsophus ebraccatus TaxID=150705 RepID=UPI0038322A0C
MDRRTSVTFLWITCQCFHLYPCCNVTELLSVKNLSLTIKNNEASLTWDCDESMKTCENISYDVFLKDQNLKSEFVTQAYVCGEEISIVLEKDTPSIVCFMVMPILNDEIDQNSSEICSDQGRSEMTGNITCTVYNTSSMKCSWDYSESLPYNAKYSVSLQQGTTIHCQQYIYDLEMRTGSCSFQDLNINYFDDVTIILNRNGSTVLKDIFKLAEKEILNPPRNLTVIYTKENFILSWKRPHTQYEVSETCFEYQMEKNKELISHGSNSPFHSNLEKECRIRIRAKGEPTCGMNTNWGQWSKEISCEAPQEPSDKTEFIILGILLGLSVFLIVLTFIISIHYKRIAKAVFPRIPQPRNYFDETLDDNLKQIQIH